MANWFRQDLHGPYTIRYPACLQQVIDAISLNELGVKNSFKGETIANALCYRSRIFRGRRGDRYIHPPIPLCTLACSPGSRLIETYILGMLEKFDDLIEPFKQFPAVSFSYSLSDISTSATFHPVRAGRLYFQNSVRKHKFSGANPYRRVDLKK